MMTPRYKKWILAFIWAGVPFVVYLWQSNALKNWIVDDAGISFVYSRNLASGYGLVSQPGVSPVECYSNFTWVAALSPFFAIRWFDPLLTPKLLSAILVLAAFIVMGSAVRSFSDYRWAASLFVLLLMAVNTSFVVWTSSGLENPLYIFLIAVMFSLVILSIQNSGFPPGYALGIGLVCALIALTRPDGILYAVLLPVSWFLILWGKKNTSWKTWFYRVVLLGVSFGLVFGAYILFRRLYFGEYFPNTYYAKGGPSLTWVNSILLLKTEVYNRLSELNRGFANKYGNILFAAFTIAWLGLIFRGSVKKQHLALLSFYAVSVFAFILMPRDWMGEYRFATPVVLLFYPGLVLAGELWLNKMVRNLTIRYISAGLIALLFFGLCLRIFERRTQAFAASPNVPLSEVALNLGIPYNRAAQKLGIKDGSLLVPDLGGTLYVTNLRIYDLAGLCDATIARTGVKNQPAFYDYIFDVVRPTFIHTHFPWDQVANLDADPRFRREYTPITESVDPQNNFLAGDYVRKDVVAGREKLLPDLLTSP